MKEEKNCFGNMKKKINTSEGNEMRERTTLRTIYIYVFDTSSVNIMRVEVLVFILSNFRYTFKLLNFVFFFRRRLRNFTAT